MQRPDRIPPSVFVYGREGKWPGDWALTRTTDGPIEQINTDREKREKDVLDNEHTICGNK
ncbi:Uncharacterized protein FWK35_00011367 [Aphis craccivora]|uniref:Uncharacterized protein n=1 Tax=Aphis craccivora TaxID=307492 RepID=A0A6G0YV90_APHCR|nr:Uncharacterized protein FWK35_00011367 [Aphis craccivora]